MRQQVSKDLYEYWSHLKAARAAPDRADIDPDAIRHILADTFIIEVDAARSFPLRLCGTRLNALWLREQKGNSFVELWRRDDRLAIAGALATVVDGVAPVVAGARTEARGQAPVELELLLLPLRHFGKTHSRVLGSLAPNYRPNWLGTRSAGRLDLISMRVLDKGSQRPSASNCRPFVDRRALAARARLVVLEGGKSP